MHVAGPLPLISWLQQWLRWDHHWHSAQLIERNKWLIRNLRLTGGGVGAGETRFILTNLFKGWVRNYTCFTEVSCVGFRRLYWQKWNKICVFSYVWNHLKPKKNPVGHGSELKRQETVQNQRDRASREASHWTRWALAASRLWIRKKEQRQDGGKGKL